MYTNQTFVRDSFIPNCAATRAWEPSAQANLFGRKGIFSLYMFCLDRQISPHLATANSVTCLLGRIQDMSKKLYSLQNTPVIGAQACVGFHLMPCPPMLHIKYCNIKSNFHNVDRKFIICNFLNNF